MLDLGPINLGFEVFNRHLVRFHVPRDVYEFFDSEQEEETEGDDDSLDDESSDSDEDEEGWLADDEREFNGEDENN